ncbi:MAG TPA: hypothetical protein VEL74_21900 [Thermoanaerobaculia bacterium]|nr:hypothetical protein [Thermoanaerobaculia bacterium]
MPDLPQSAPLDLDRFSEALRRWLYDRVVRIHFDRSDTTVPYDPDAAGLQVICLGGRWFAVWRDLEEPPSAPERLRLQVVGIRASPDDPGDIELYAV